MKVKDLDIEVFVELIRNCVRAELNQQKKIQEALEEDRKSSLLKETSYIARQIAQALGEWNLKHNK